MEVKAQLIAQEAEIARLNIAVLALHAETLKLRATIDNMRASVSWRVSLPVRIFGSMCRSIIARQPKLANSIRTMRGKLRPVAMPAVLQVASTDPGAAYIFKPVPVTDDDSGIVGLNALYYLSRAIE